MPLDYIHVHVARVRVSIHVRNSLLANTHGKVASSLGSSSAPLLHNVGHYATDELGRSLDKRLMAQ